MDRPGGLSPQELNGRTQNYEKTLSDSSAFEGAGYSRTVAVGEPADDAGGDSSAHTDLEDDRVPGPQDLRASRLSGAVARWAVPAGNSAEEDAVRLRGAECRYALFG